MPSSGYSNWSVIAGETPTTAKWNILGVNDASFNTGTGFNDAIIINRHLAAQSAWVTITYQNSWVAYDLTNFPGGRYMQDTMGFVHFSGLVKSGTINAVMFTLPVGLRPILAIHFPVVSNGAFGNIRIDTNGNVTPQTGSNVWYSLDGITFKAEQ